MVHQRVDLGLIHHEVGGLLMLLHLGAYQTLELIQEDLGEQFTRSGDEPHTLIARVTSAIDEKFVNCTVTILLTEEAQRDIISAFQRNLHGEVI